MRVAIAVAAMFLHQPAPSSRNLIVPHAATSSSGRSNASEMR